MADSGLRISWAIPADRRPRRGELDLLRLLLQLAGVFQGRQDLRFGAPAQTGETDQQFAAAALHRQRQRAVATAFTPLLQRGVQSRH